MNKKIIIFYIVAIALVIGAAVLATTISGNTGAVNLCFGIIVGVAAIMIMKAVNYRKNNKK